MRSPFQAPNSLTLSLKSHWPPHRPKGTRQLIISHTVTIKCQNLSTKMAGQNHRTFLDKKELPRPGLVRASDERGCQVQAQAGSLPPRTAYHGIYRHWNFETIYNAA